MAGQQIQRVVCTAFGPPEDLTTEHTDAPQPGPNEVVVDVRAAGVGFVDGLMVQGLYQVKPTLPYYPGSEFSGVIARIGSDVSTWQPGQRVMGLAGAGAYADEVQVRARGLVALPASLDDATAAGFYINYATALYGLRDCGKLQPDETILILGAAGGVGSAAIAVAKAMGAQVIAGASSAAKREAALTFGADATLDYTQPEWRKSLKAMLPQGGLKLVYDPVGGELAEPAFRSLAPGGRHLVVGFASGTIPKLPFNLALLKRAQLVGVDWGGEYRANPAINDELMHTLMDWTESGKLQPAAVVTRDMSEIRTALKDQLAGAIVGKLVLTNQ